MLLSSMFLSATNGAKGKIFRFGRALAPVGLIVAFHAIVTVANGQLKWDRHEMEFAPTPSDSKIIAHFTFTNIGKKPVTIKSVKSTCGCTSLLGDKKAYQPEDRGEITAVFEFGQRYGVHDKMIMVQSDDPSESNTLLKFKVTIPELLRVTPVFVYWFTGEPKEPKAINVKVVYSSPIKVLNAKSNNDRFVVQLETLREGREYSVRLTPKDTGQPVMATIDIATDFPVEKPKIFKIYAMVKPR